MIIATMPAISCTQRLLGGRSSTGVIDRLLFRILNSKLLFETMVLTKIHLCNSEQRWLLGPGWGEASLAGRCAAGLGEYHERIASRCGAARSRMRAEESD